MIRRRPITVAPKNIRTNNAERQAKKTGVMLLVAAPALAILFLLSLSFSIYSHNMSDLEVLWQDGTDDGLVAEVIWNTWKQGGRVGRISASEMETKGRYYQRMIDAHHQLRDTSTVIAVVSLLGCIAIGALIAARNRRKTTKECPMCCKQVALAARKCPFCQSVLDSPATKIEVDSERMPKLTPAIDAAHQEKAQDEVSTDRILHTAGDKKSPRPRGRRR
jgi:hypothetical protein